MVLSSDDSRCWLGLTALAILTLTPMGCADARGRFEDYRTRLGNRDAGSEASPDAAGPCSPPEPGALTGPALLAIDTSLSDGHPILFLGSIDTPGLDGATAVQFVYRALDSLDRHTLVGEEMQVGPYPVSETGEFVARVPQSELDGAANPLVHGVPITSEMILSGQVCGLQRVYCGTLQGKTTGYVSGPFSGTFAITLLDAPDAIPERPRYGCGADDLAPALAP